MDLGLTGKVAIVTGGSRGLGLAAARALIAEGTHVVICARGEEQLQTSAKGSCCGGLGHACQRGADVSADAGVTRARCGRQDSAAGVVVTRRLPRSPI